MILAVHQPQYLPWLGYFHKIANCDLFLFLDDVQYKKREFQNRNKIKTPAGELWLTIPVITKGHFTQNIKDVQINKEENWESQHWASIVQNYSKAPYFGEHKEFFKKLYEVKWDLLIDISMEIIRYSLSYLEIKTPIKMSSEYNVLSQSTERIVELCKKTGADTYFSGSGGKAYMDEKLFTDSSIKLTYQDFHHQEYKQSYTGFMPYLSIIDLLFNCGKDSKKILLGN